MNNSKIKVALIGSGWVVKFFHMPLLSAVSDLSVDVIGTNRISEVSKEFPDLLVLSPEEASTRPGIDLVIIATVNNSHVQLAELALRSGKHVVVEKPFTPTLDEARYLAELADREGKILSVFHNRRWDSDFLTVKNAIRAGLLGDVVHFESHIDRFVPTVANAWREQPGPAAGMWFDLGPHIGDQAMQLFGIPNMVTAIFAQQRHSAQTDDWFHVILEYGNLRVILHAAQLVPSGGVRFTVHGTNGSLIKRKADPQESQMLAGLKPYDAGWGIDTDNAVFHPANDNHNPKFIDASPGDQCQFYIELVRAIKTGSVSPVAPSEAVVMMALLETAAKSAIEKCSLPLPLTVKEQEDFEQLRRQRN